MAYIHPSMVLSPKNQVKDLSVVYDGKEHGWSLAKFKWTAADGTISDAVGIRWNGGSGDSRFPGIGNPQSRGVPTWFVLPEDVATVVLKLAEDNNKAEVR